MSEPTTEAGRRLLRVMGTVPPQGRQGLAWFVDAIETEARNLGYADGIESHLDGFCDSPITSVTTPDGDVDRLARVLEAVHVPEITREVWSKRQFYRNLATAIAAEYARLRAEPEANDD